MTGAGRVIRDAIGKAALEAIAQPMRDRIDAGLTSEEIIDGYRTTFFPDLQNTSATAALLADLDAHIGPGRWDYPQLLVRFQNTSVTAHIDTPPAGERYDVICCVPLDGLTLVTTYRPETEHELRPGDVLIMGGRTVHAGRGAGHGPPRLALYARRFAS